jgi:hypothetical protein
MKNKKKETARSVSSDALQVRASSYDAHHGQSSTQAKLVVVAYLEAGNDVICGGHQLDARHDSVSG